ncbi:MAG: helix-turn-helix transcriptional regulator [Polyangiaceae bacterium]
MADLKMEIGRRVRQLRRARRGPGQRGLTIRALARRAALSEDYLNKLELGRYMPSAETLLALAAALDVRVADLLPHTERHDERGEALDELCAVASRFSASEIRYLIAVVGTVMDYPRP